MHLFKLTSLTALSLASLLICSGGAFADVQFVAPGVAGSVTNLAVGGDVYNVTFVGNITHIAWVNQLDFSTEAEAEAAIVALAAELNAVGGVTALRFTTPSSTFDHNVGQLWYAADATTLFGETLIRSGSTWQLAFPFPGGSTAPLNGAYPLALDFTLVSPSPWTDLGGASLGSAGEPALVGTGDLVGGSSTSLTLTNAPPSAAMLAWVSFAPVPFAALGGTVHAYPFASQLFLFANAGGGFNASTAWPLGIPAGTEVTFQFLVQDFSSIHGITLSNGLCATTP